jgi:hypothetical protein
MPAELRVQRPRHRVGQHIGPIAERDQRPPQVPDRGAAETPAQVTRRAAVVGCGHDCGQLHVRIAQRPEHGGDAVATAKDCDTCRHRHG